MADDYTDCEVSGIDLSPVQTVFVPPNCTFYVGNVLEGLFFHEDKFDLIQSRAIMAGIPADGWVSYLQEVKRMLKPGGWVQLVEIDPFLKCDDGSLPEDSAMKFYTSVISEVVERKNGCLCAGLGLKQPEFLKEAGFINIKENHKRAPTGWAEGMISSRHHLH